eukprot:1760337-Amphidinium_carterae.1
MESPHQSHNDIAHLCLSRNQDKLSNDNFESARWPLVSSGSSKPPRSEFTLQDNFSMQGEYQVVIKGVKRSRGDTNWACRVCIGGYSK